MQDHYKNIEEQLNIKKYSYKDKEYKFIGEMKFKDGNKWVDVVCYEALYECEGTNQFTRRSLEFYHKFTPIN